MAAIKLSCFPLGYRDFNPGFEPFIPSFGPYHGKEPSLRANPTSLFLAAIEMAAIFLNRKGGRGGNSIE